MKQCTNCNFKSEQSSDLFCAVCGARLKDGPVNSRCKSCGAELKPYARFCTKCGAAVTFFSPTLSSTAELYSDISISVTAGKEGSTANPRVQSSLPPAESVQPPAPPAKVCVQPPAPTKGNNDVGSLILTKTDVLVAPDQNGKYSFSDDSDGETPDDPYERFLSKEEIRSLGEKALEVIPERVAYYAPLVGVKYGRITIRNYKSKWGSCTSSGKLKFNCILMLAPPKVVDSVVVHELCHILQLNHSDKFYAEVLRVFPDYWKWDAWLDEHGALLWNMEDGYVFRSSVASTGA